MHSQLKLELSWRLLSTLSSYHRRTRCSRRFRQRAEQLGGPRVAFPLRDGGSRVELARRGRPQGVGEDWRPHRKRGRALWRDLGAAWPEVRAKRAARRLAELHELRPAEPERHAQHEDGGTHSGGAEAGGELRRVDEAAVGQAERRPLDVHARRARPPKHRVDQPVVGAGQARDAVAPSHLCAHVEEREAAHALRVRRRRREAARALAHGGADARALVHLLEDALAWHALHPARVAKGGVVEAHQPRLRAVRHGFHRHPPEQRGQHGQPQPPRALCAHRHVKGRVPRCRPRPREREHVG
mmetsp:Transcript_33241/g.82781  ORF Transcript_33241/g.82781 Transcript_33241/m.82781 type:complete len:299 (-) Transcript_33241:1733-2629(-)